MAMSAEFLDPDGLKGWAPLPPTSRAGQRPVAQSRHSSTWAAGVRVLQVHVGTGPPVRLGLRAVHPGHPPATMFLRECSTG